MCLCVCVRARERERETEEERRRSGGLWRNEGVQGQSEGTGLFSRLVDEELIRGEIFSFLLFFFFWRRGRNRKRSLEKSV